MISNKARSTSKKSIFHFARAAKVTDNAPRSCPQNGVTSYATFVCWPDLHTGLLLLLALAFVLFYEAINGFHDTANAVATVIYTRAMRSQLAVVMAAVFNFLAFCWGSQRGVCHCAYATDGSPAQHGFRARPRYGLFHVAGGDYLEPRHRYFGLPASSSHTLIGAIIGIGLTNAMMTGTSVVDALNIPKVINIFGSLIISLLSVWYSPAV